MKTIGQFYEGQTITLKPEFLMPGSPDFIHTGLYQLLRDIKDKTGFSGALSRLQAVVRTNKVNSGGEHISVEWLNPFTSERLDIIYAMKEQDIEKEIQARVEFKMNELLTGVKNRVGHKYGQAFDMTKESQYALEAFRELEQMVKKEIEMSTPSNHMDRDKKWAAKEIAVKNIMEHFKCVGSEYHSKVGKVVSEIEDAQNY